MTIWTPKHKAGIRTQWAPPAGDATWTESNLLVYSTQIKQVRMIHLQNVYRYMYHWLKDEQWKSSKGDDWFEDYYAEWRDQHDHKEIRWWWRLERSPGGIAGAHNFFRQKWYIDVLTTNMKRVEIMYKGKKIKPYVGEFLMWFNAVLELDINNWFGKGTTFKLGEFLEDFFLRMIYKERVRDQEVELRRESERFIEDVKFYIGLHRMDDTRKPIEDSKQWF